MNLEELEKSNLIIFRTISGSHAYNLNIETSDIDIRGIFRLPKESHLSLIDPSQEVGSESQDIKFYELKKFLNLAKDCNPNIIELFWHPKECIQICTPIMQKLIDNRNLFITKRAFSTFSGYSWAQIKKAKGRNKLVNNPLPKEPPKKEDFCWIIPLALTRYNPSWHDGTLPEFIKNCPCRPIELKRMGWDLSKYHVASLEHSSNMYRLYVYGDDAKGVFRGDGMLTCESIPFEDERDRFVGILIYSEQEYNKALNEYKQYWDWMEKRNTTRWTQQENKEADFDCKNMMHCFRLLYSGKNILLHGEPLIRFEGEQREFLMSIRNNKCKYDDLIKMVEEEMLELETLKEKSTLPWGPDIHKIDKLYKELMDL